MSKIEHFIVCLFILFSPVQSTVNGAPFTVVIDAGHGGRDPGARGKTINEKTINLDVALQLGALIRANHSDVKVIYTRTRDVFVDLQVRADIANKAKADLFISIHTNAVKSRTISGTETYTLGLARSEENLEVAKRENSVILMEDDYSSRYEGFDPRSSESYIIFELLQNSHFEHSISFAADIQKEFRSSARRTDRGVRQAGFLVLRNTSMPSVLVELGYISNPTEERYLGSKSGRGALAKSIYRAFTKYKQSVDRRGGEASTVKRPTSDRSAPTVDRPSADLRTSSTGAIVYKIQILSSDKKLPSNSKAFKGLKPIESYQENKLYKYTYKQSSSFAEIERERKKIRHLFKDAFVVRFKDGVRVK